jgi:LPS sulfotransferase NodH
MRIGLIATSRSGSTYFRRFLCNTFGLYDPASWLKNNDYKDIEKENWATQPHLLKILPHYIPEDQHFGEMISGFPCIWLYRKDILSQFLSHVTRLRTKVNHIHYENERPDIPDSSLIATKEEFDRFMTKLEQFWDIYYTHNEGALIDFEAFLDDPLVTLAHLQELYGLKADNTVRTQLTIKLGIDYEKKFENIEEIKGWFD